MEWSAGNVESFDKGSGAVRKMLEIEITPEGLRRLDEKVGEERADLRDADVKAFQGGKLEPLYPSPLKWRWPCWTVAGLKPGLPTLRLGCTKLRG